jgi:hypothetical protein
MAIRMRDAICDGERRERPKTHFAQAIVEAART